MHVDELGAKGHWLGLVVPKRHAKRAVTRNLIKRQLRAAMLHHAPALPEGLWVVRLRAPFDRQAFKSPSSEVLRLAAHAEIGALFDRAARSPLPPQPPKPRGRR
jgi:ribonuclease P protein component